MSPFISVFLGFLTCGMNAECVTPSFCRDEYNSTTKEFYRTYWGLTEVPTNIPAEALEVDLQHNSISSLPPGIFGHLSQCTKLSLENNRIILIESDSFSGLTALKFLFLWRNNIPNLPAKIFKHFKMLESLDLWQNDISSIDKEAFTGIKSLRYLQLFSNRIAHIQSGTFGPLGCLWFLSLADNGLSSIQNDTFLGLHSLRTLHLDGNNLSLVHPAGFNGLTSLKNLYLYNNKLVSLSQDVFQGLPRPLKLSMSDRTSQKPQYYWNCSNQLECPNQGMTASVFVRLALIPEKEPQKIWFD